MKRPFEVDATHYPFESHWCDVSGVPIHYIDEGTGPIILFLHGNFLWSFSYRKLIQELSKEYRCLAIDLAGMGMSGKPHLLNNDFSYTFEEQSYVVEAVLSTLKVSDVTLVAHDHGGAIGLGVVTRRPELFIKLLITNSWMWSDWRFPTKIWSWMAPKLSTTLFKNLRERKLGSWESKESFHQAGVWEAYLAPYTTREDLKPVTALAAELTQAKNYLAGVREKISKLPNLAVQIIWATAGGGPYRLISFSDFVDKNKLLKKWQDVFPNANTTILKDAGYYFVTDPPKEFVDTLREFVKQSLPFTK